MFLWPSYTVWLEKAAKTRHEICIKERPKFSTLSYLILTLGTVDIFARRKHVHNGGPQGSVLCPEWTVYVQRTVPRQMLNLSQ